ncbi:MAG TPA: BadF/BadG/BcrA/BcrD ATPase family protein [Candidatus Hydrogenedentes bacterium]|nr:BadF/BadG/BcrA/BcrD ATPase family protein [Candidatus Hydrogenedentota bacterium]HOV72943.1 BadF/BadG/BcrA/BcrD ATPase family protein [Candidatus Hydrogenedentota bacterium]HPC15789.1 BadF/BadG/BcrA/BcrD ATPase family protein [Candidatus Hydrogenedentota bacterium]HRT19803.1 BadF/BadG/BcrA/BcrD ATPase family protein [Candidatus Hydrogenedentota bacterium]HRT64576.1 BadF/BadG/BcrA/BcrD ATPase family protein [Candidatus Hydrogenedentota bacterium]
MANAKTKRYYLGIDAGGTKTFCLVGDDEGHILGFGRAGAGNYECFGVEPAAVENRKAVEGALKAAGLALKDISGIGMGIAGADLPEDYDMLERAIYTPLFGAIPRVFRNDSMGGLRGGTRNPYGIVIACGTGCVCAGVNRAGRHTRVGGLGEEFGDWVSGSSIGLRGIQAVWQARDRIIPPTLLTRLFVEKGGCRDVDELFYKLYRREMAPSALQPMAKLVFDAAYEGDAAACEILEWGGRYLAKMVCAVAVALEMQRDEFEVVMAGSVFKGSSPVLADTMRMDIHRVCPLARTVMPVFEPVVGALLMGMELDIVVTDAIYETLSRELREAEKRYEVRFQAE